MLIKGLEHLKWHLEAESWGCPALKREGSGQNFIKVFKYLMGRSKEDAARLFSAVPSEKKNLGQTLEQAAKFASLQTFKM